MSTAVSSCTKRSSSIFASRSAIGCSKSRKLVLALAMNPPVSVFHRYRIEAAPEIPGRNAAIRCPAGSQFFQILAAGAPHQVLARLAVEVKAADGLDQTQVVDRIDIWT